MNFNSKLFYASSQTGGDHSRSSDATAALKVRQDCSFANGTFGEYESKQSSQNPLVGDSNNSLVIDKQQS